MPDFVDGAFSVPVGQVSAPVHTQFGWHLILVDKATTLPFDQAKAGVQQYASAKATAALRQVLRDGAKGDISVNPRYGTWDPRRARVLPPGSTASTTTTAPGDGEPVTDADGPGHRRRPRSGRPRRCSPRPRSPRSSRVPQRFLRTARHPAASCRGRSDELRRRVRGRGALDDVYPEIVRRLVAAAD